MTTTATAPAVQAIGLCKTFTVGRGLAKRTLTAVDDVSFTLRTGTTLAVVGESGSGKTTVSRMVVGLETPTSGEVLLDDEPRPARMSRRQTLAHARRIQMVFQNPARSLDPRQPIGAAISELLAQHGALSPTDRRARTVELLDLVHLPARVFDAYPSDLSGGQQQRACIARALAVEPRVLVLDEAVSALDVSVQAQVLNVLSDVREHTAVSYLFITHDLAVVRQVADDVMVMRAGRIVEAGPADRVLDDPQDPYTRILRDSVPRAGWRPVRAS